MEAQGDLSSLGLPPIDQIGFVVRDLDEAERRYAALFGPMTRQNPSLNLVEGATYRGRTADANLAIMFGHSGELEVEFIQWLSGDSPHREFIEQGREGIQHVRYRVDDTDAWIERVDAIGYRPIWYMRYTEEIVFAYLEREGDPLLIEFLQMPEHLDPTVGVDRDGRPLDAG